VEHTSDTDLKRLVLAEAQAAGFAAARVAAPAAIGPEAAQRLGRFLREGWHGDMGWMATTADRRGDRKSVVQARRAQAAGDPSRAPHNENDKK
jgi:epoxyqueuosine reductase